MNNKQYLANLNALTKQKTASYVVQFFPNTDLRSSHNGLTKVAKKAGLNPDDLVPGEYLVFVNRSRSQLKMYAAGNVIAQLKAPKNNLIDYRVVKYVPRFFNGAQINFQAAQREALKEQVPELFGGEL